MAKRDSGAAVGAPESSGPVGWACPRAVSGGGGARIVGALGARGGTPSVPTPLFYLK